MERAKHEWEAEQEEDRLALEEQHVKKLEILREKLKEQLQQQHEVCANNDVCTKTYLMSYTNHYHYVRVEYLLISKGYVKLKTNT